MTSKLGFALVLHAHLPYVRECAPFGVVERWYHEALWECYLPLVAMLDAHAAAGLAAPFTLSVSPPLASMLADPVLARRFEDHVAALAELDRRLGVGGVYGTRLDIALARWERCERRPLARLAEHALEARIELTTTSASHAFLPGLGHLDGGVVSQLRVGAASFERLTGRAVSRGRWVPECAVDERVTRALASAGVGHTVLDPRALGSRDPTFVEVAAPRVTPHGTAFFVRDRVTTNRVWSRRGGYPGHAVYREFHRDVGYELAHERLGPFGAGAMTGLKYWAIGRSGAQQPRYEPRVAEERAAHDAEDFVAHLESLAAHEARDGARDGERVVVAAFDAELFGHWWFEGPTFLDHVLRRLATSATVRPVTLSGCLAEQARLAQPTTLAHAEPRASSWGHEGAFAEWVGPRTARVWRAVHGVRREIASRARSGRDVVAVANAAREMFLLEASDWPYLLATGSMTEFAAARLKQHAERALAWLSRRPPPERTDFLRELDDAWLVEAIASS